MYGKDKVEYCILKAYRKIKACTKSGKAREKERERWKVDERIKENWIDLTWRPQRDNQNDRAENEFNEQ
jgi:hypothetical protein